MQVEEGLSNLDVFDLVWATCKHILQCDDNTALPCVQKRAGFTACAESVHALDVFMGLDEGLQVLNRDDENDIRENQKKAKANASQSDEFSNKYKAQRAKTQPLPKAKAQAKSRRGGSAGSRQPFVPAVPAGALTQQGAKLLLPEGMPAIK